ncbi:NAD(P)-binding domain-containing protein [Paenibacillus sp. LHD-38]|uniref:NAD(P)-binding domain-containing protein n=1 Tax=Paenibacillus sp. LHD-38 TaxID=3072143 RepID=UPI00280C74A0|nr:NAD(P)-binding domain-containing protein [Paenibacillus sp. LHD-38]MDQ8737173.1 NAD(P)-binding domain-containing protein [Paenibacillus sp. LHD-38]
MKNQLPVAIIGGGPVALAAAAQLTKRKIPFVLLEQGTSVGASVLEWGHIRMFSPWEFNIDSAASELLTETGWIAPPKEELPTGKQLFDQYLYPLSELSKLKTNIRTEARVVAIHRQGFDKMKTAGREKVPFEVVYESNNVVYRVEASAVIDATGTWKSPNPIGASGDYAAQEADYSSHIHYGIPDIKGAHAKRYTGKTVAVVGSGHSAIHAILLLHELKLQNPATTIHWVLRKQSIEDAFGGGELDGLPARGVLGSRAAKLVREGLVNVHTPFYIHGLEQEGEKLNLIGTGATINGVDEIIAATGARPNFSFIRELRYAADSSIECVPKLADLIDPNIHSCGTVRPHGEAELSQPEHRFYIVGAKSYGRAPTFLLATGYEQVRSVVAALAGDWDSAREVKLHLPETGVCSVSRPKTALKVTNSSCCGPAVGCE